METEKTPKELAQKEVNKRIAKMIAERQLEIKRHEAAIKKLNKEIEKIESGELVPAEDSDESSDYISEIRGLRSEINRLERERNKHYIPYSPDKLFTPSKNWTYATTSGRY